MNRLLSFVMRVVLGMAPLVTGVAGFSLAPAPAMAAPSCTASVTDGGTTPVAVLYGGTVATSATLSFSCTGMVPGLPVTLCPNLDSGSGGGNGSGGRLLSGSGGSLPFQIYQDAGYSQPWGSTSFLQFGATPTITITPAANGKASTTRTLYAQITATASTPPGTYSTTFTNQNFFWGLNLLSCAGITIGTYAIPAAFTFTATVAPDCILGLTDLKFGSVGLLSQAITAQNDISVRCTSTTPWSIGLGYGANGTSPTTRKMANGANRVNYGIFLDNGYAQPWGLLADGAAYVRSGVGDGLNHTDHAYGRTPAQTTPAAGSYSDQVVVTVTY